jgi:hypothetical protein
VPRLAGIRGEHWPVAAVPFVLTGGPPTPKPSHRPRTTRTAGVVTTTKPPRRPATVAPAPVRLPLLERLHLTDEWGVLILPGDGPEALQRWFHGQEPAHGKEKWFARMRHLIAEGLFDRARQVAICARELSLVRAYMRSRSPEERAANVALSEARTVGGSIVEAAHETGIGRDSGASDRPGCK